MNANANANANILTRQIDTLIARTALKQKNSQNTLPNFPVISYTGPEGRPVFGTYHPINAFNTRWVLISEIDQVEALAVAHWLARITVIVLLITALLVIGPALFQARRITQPLIALAKASRDASSGKLDQRVEVASNDEIGQLADDFNLMLALRSAHVDVLERSHRETEQALAELAEQKFALDQHALVSVTDLNGTITFANQKFVDVSGYKMTEIMGQNHRVINSGHHPQSFWAHMYKTLASGNIWHGDICNMNKQGAIYWVASTVVPFRNQTGSIQSYVAIRTEITEQKQVEAALHEARTIAEGATEAKSDFLANMSHEIRTPMNGVIGMTNLLLDGELNENQHQRARTIKRSAEALLGIINDILDFSKIEAGKLDLEPIEFDLGELLSDMAEAHSIYSENSEVELICPANPMDSQWFIGDPGRIRQILTNLVGNAQKFTTKGEIAVHFNALDPVEGLCKLHFEVTDTGIGLSKSQQEKLFERFSQADATTTREYGGTGLGLSISSQLVEMMDGEIGVRSVENEGSTFWFTINLPIAEHRRETTELVDLSSQRMLIVDDNATNRQLLHELLSSWQIQHDKVSNGPRALQALYDGIENQNPYTLVLLDMHMPGLDGSRLGKQIISEDLFADTKVLMVTAQGRRGDGERMNKAGFAGALSKPINQKTLYSQLLAISGISRITERSQTEHTNRDLPQFSARVLVVEDNTTNQQVAKGMLAKFGIDVDIAADGQEALRTLALLPYDLVFMDCQMPVMDGFEATALIRDQSWHCMDPDIPVVAMTANARPEDHARCLEAGMDDYVSKPIDPTKLSQALIRWLPEPSQPDQDADTAAPKLIDIEHPVDHSIGVEPTDAPVKPRRLMVNDDELMRMVTAAFMGDLVDQTSYLKELVANNSVQEAVLQAHKIRNSAINVGGVALSILANKLEQQGHSDEVSTISQGMPKLEKILTLEDGDRLNAQFPGFITAEINEIGLAPSDANNTASSNQPNQPETPGSENPDFDNAIQHANDR
ncbi:MAG: response regulator [Immundisolibacteraceae bacterium]|nr:response regulator [Immundisolibacteraceae bacterium]